MLRSKEYKVADESIQSGLVRSSNTLPLTNFNINTNLVNFASYNLCGFYFLINHSKHFLAEDLSNVLIKLKSQEEKIDTASLVDPQVLGSLYSTHTKSYVSYFIPWLIAKKLNHKQESIKTMNDVDLIVDETIEEFNNLKTAFIRELEQLKNNKKHEKNASLIDSLLDSLQSEININAIKESEILKFAFSKNAISDFNNEIKFGIAKRGQLERCQIWYKRQNAVFDTISHAIEKMGINIFNFQEGNAEPLMQLKQYLSQKNLDFTLVAYSDQTGERMDDLSPIEAEGFKAKDGLGFSNPILFDSKRFNIKLSKQFWISETPDQPSSTPGGIPHQKNSITAVILQDRIHDEYLVVFNTHITPSDKGHDYSQKKVAEIINKFIAESKKSLDIAEDKILPFIFSGDLNTYPDLAHEGGIYLAYKKDLNAIEVRDMFSEKICANQMLAPATFLGFEFDPACNQLTQNGDSTELRPQTLDHGLFNGFKAGGHAFKMASPVKIENDECVSILNVEISEDNTAKNENFKEALKKHHTASDHMMIGAQLSYSFFANKHKPKENQVLNQHSESCQIKLGN